MLDLDFHPAGRHFLQIPGPTPVPDRILRAMSLPTIDHRGPEFGLLGRQVLTAVREVFKTRHPVVIYPGSGTGAWEAALSNTLSPGDHVLIYETGHFASLWAKMATRLGSVSRGARVDRQGRPVAARAELASRCAGRSDRATACGAIPSARSKRSASYTTRLRPARFRTSLRYAPRSMQANTPRC